MDELFPDSTRRLRRWLPTVLLTLNLMAIAPSLAETSSGNNTQTPAIVTTELHLEMNETDAEVLFRKNPYDRSRFDVKVVDGEKKHEGKVAVKGSFSRHFLKKSLLITLPAEQAWQGRRRIALNAMATDPTQAREWMAWDLVRRMGMARPQVELRKLYVNDTYIGLYLDIEWMDEAMFSRLGFGKGGQFFQPNDEGYCGDLTLGSMTRSAECWSQLFPRDSDMSALHDMIKEIDATPAERFDVFLDQRFDAQSVIDWLVINTLTQNGDTYNKNYFLHFDGKESRWRVIPWDYDLTWGRVADVALPFPRMIYNENFQYAYPPDLGSANPLKDKTLANPKMYARYLVRLREALGEDSAKAESAVTAWYRPEQFQARLAELGHLTRSSLANEKYPSADLSRHDEEIDALMFFNEWRYQFLRNLLIVPNAFDRVRWLPNTAYPPLTPVTEASRMLRQRQTMNLSATANFTTLGERRFFIEGLLGWPLAAMRLNEGPTPARVTLETEREQTAAFVPPGQDSTACIERSWVITPKTTGALNVDLEFDYLQESSLRHELGPNIKDEHRLALWHFDGQAWHTMATQPNPIANRLRTGNVRLAPHIAHRFVACVGNAAVSSPGG